MDLEPWLARAAALRPDHPAVIDAEGRPTSYAELHAMALDAAAVLQARGIEGGERVALKLPPGRPFLAAFHATLMLGATAVPIDLRLGPAEQAARTATAKLTVDAPLRRTDEPDARPLDRLDPDAPAVVVYTSGTTAAPKPVALTVGNWLWNALGSALALGLDPEDRWLCTLPLSHVGGLAIPIRSAIYGTTVVLHERFDTEQALEAMERDRVTLASLVPTTLERLLDAGLGIGGTLSLRVALIGGGPLPPLLAARAQEAGIPAAQTYGMTEACSQVATSLPGEPETAGRPLVGLRVAIGGAPPASDGEPVVGEILVQGPTVAPGALAADGWLHTGDLGALDARGRLLVTGRKADTIVTGGENVAPVEVEAALLAHPAVADAGVYGRADARWGEAVVATVVLHDGSQAEAEELRAHVAARLARYKVPKAVAFADRLPRTASGKLMRRELSRDPATR
ncbi:MAG TPA: AMP-binding protein [Conexibacter sp.]|nr:AMP-binding protein [Conexibacter sp.]